MFALSNLVQKAQDLVDTNIIPIVIGGDKRPSKAGLFRHQFHLPDSQNPLHEITAELTLPKKPSHTTISKGKGQARASTDKDHGDKDRENASAHYVGRLHISERFLCFSTIHTSFTPTASTSASSAFTSHTHGAGPAAYGFTLPLCAVRRVERLHSQSSMFALSISTWNGYPSATDTKAVAANPSGKTAPEAPKLKIQLSGSRQQCERFCDGLKKGLRDGMKEVDSMRKVVGDCYSEFLLDLEDRRRQTKADEKPKDLLSEEPTTSLFDLTPPDTGLGTIFRYPGDPKKLRDKGKMRLWYEYMRENGRNATLVRQPDLARLIRIGLPNRLRGEIWDLMSGALYNRLQDPQRYQDTLAQFHGQESVAIDEIEKDLNRSLPEYPGFQSEDGIGRLRRVLTAYSWTNRDVGYCQAMNIVVAAMLIYLSENQAFYVLSVLCDRLLPGYYSTTMYGTLLDQRVFESLVEKTLPILSDHLAKTDIQLSVVSLPWFLSLYINSIPLVFAFRVLDVFFLEGPKVLFQVGLAILRINGEELLDATDDGNFILVLKKYFATLGESAHPKSENPKLRAVTNFQALMVVAFREFAGITQSLITEQRTKHKDAVLDNIESFAKRTSIRNLNQDCKKLSPTDLGFVYDRFYGVLYERQQRMQMIQEETERRQKSVKTFIGTAGTAPEMGRVGLGPSPTQMDYDAFREFLAGISKWAITDSPSSPMKELNTNGRQSGYFGAARSRSISMSPWGNGPEPADHDFMRRLYASWQHSDKSGDDSTEDRNDRELTLQDVAAGLAKLKGSHDIMAHIEYFFDLYDDDKDGRVDREGILRISEGMLFLSRRGLFSNIGIEERLADVTIEGAKVRRESKDEQFLGAVSAFIRRCFEYADPSVTSNADTLLPDAGPEAETRDRPSLEGAASTTNHETANAALDPNNPLHLTLPTFRMLVLADEALESFFDSGLTNSFNLADAPLPSSTLTTSTGLTTFQTAAMGDASKSGLPTMGAAAGIVAPGKGIRGMLDNIVTDGMRVAADVKRRMDEAQKELENGASKGPQHEEDEEEDEDETEGDKDLLEGMDAAAGVGVPQTASSTLKPNEPSLLDVSPIEPSTATSAKSEADEVKSSTTVFER